MYPDTKDMAVQSSTDCGMYTHSNNPANSGQWLIVGLMLGQRCRRWSSIKPAVGQRIMFAGKVVLAKQCCIQCDFFFISAGIAFRHQILTSQSSQLNGSMLIYCLRRWPKIKTLMAPISRNCGTGRDDADSGPVLEQQMDSITLCGTKELMYGPSTMFSRFVFWH